jgi:glycosyltransferase involved in cell wall biosynthesis
MYNASRYIEETLHSVFAQTRQDFEIILVDDGSTDGSVELVERTFRDPRITIVRQPHQTLRVARPAAVARANGEFVAFLDHDDLWLPDKLQRQIAAARATPEAALIFSDCLIIDGSGHTIGRLSDQYDFGTIDLSGTRGYLELLRRGCFVAYPTAFARRAAIGAVGGFNQAFQYVSDYDLWLRLARRYQLNVIAEPLAKYRVHPTQFTQCHSDITLAEHGALLRPVISSASYPPHVRRALEHNLFGQHRVAFGLLLGQRRFSLAARAALGSCRYPVPLRQYCRHRLATSPIGPVMKSGLAACRRLRNAISRARGVTNDSQNSNATPTHVWIDGSSLGYEQTGYFNLLSELIRSLAQHQSPPCIVHVATQASGRTALLVRLGADGAALQFHRIGWRAVHWSHIHRLLFGWQAQLLLTLLSVIAIAYGAATASSIALGLASVMIAGQAAVLLDELIAEGSAVFRRPRLQQAARIVRFLWRKLPAPRRRASASNTVEVLFWRGRFKWRDSHRVAIVQDLTTLIYPELHPRENVVEFDEFLGYVQRHAHTIVTVSEHSRQDIIERLTVCPDRVSVVPMPVHPQYVRPQFRQGFVACHGITGPYVLSVGTIEPRKNLRRLVKAFELLKEEAAAKDVTLVLVGPPGWDAGFQEFLIGMDVRRRVRVTGFVPIEHLPSLYHFASATIAPSLYEGFGIPVLEAMCSSAIVLASRISSLPEVLGKHGIYFDPYSTEDIARALLTALTLSPADAASYRRQCRQRADAHLDRLANEVPLPGLVRESVLEKT